MGDYHKARTKAYEIVYKNNWKFSYELHLDKKYNIFWTCFPQYEKDKYILSKDAYVIHFIGNRKPWSYSKKQIKKQLTDLLFDGKHFRLMFFYLNICIFVNNMIVYLIHILVCINICLVLKKILY